MQIKENVYEATPQTEDGAAAQEEKPLDVGFGRKFAAGKASVD